jgi:hypothetical protein
VVAIDDGRKRIRNAALEEVIALLAGYKTTATNDNRPAAVALFERLLEEVRAMKEGDK